MSRCRQSPIPLWLHWQMCIKIQTSFIKGRKSAFKGKLMLLLLLLLSSIIFHYLF